MTTTLELPAEETLAPQEGPQLKAASSCADILIYGGSAFGGKSFYLELEACRHVHVPGFKAVIVRKTTTEITDQGGLWDESFNIYPHLDGEPKVQSYRWVFPSGASVRFRHLESRDYRVEWKGTQACYLAIDQLEDIPEEAFFYLLSRNRSTCGVPPYVRASCNPQPGWLADFLSWWIDQETGYPIPERDGVLRWMARQPDDSINWYDSPEEAIEDNPHMVAATPTWRPKSVTFIRAKLEDNKIGVARDPGYVSNLLSMPKIERMRLYDGNWKIRPDAIFEAHWLRRFGLDGEAVVYQCGAAKIRSAIFERFAVVDTAGTGKQKAAEKKGKPPSYSCSGIFDYDKGTDTLLVRALWRKRATWTELKAELPMFLDFWGIRELRIENAHFGPALANDFAEHYRCILVNPVVEGMAAVQGRSAKLERAVASGLLSRVEFGTMLFSPDPALWAPEYDAQLWAWGGLDDEAADIVDVLSYASDRVYKRKTQRLLVA